MVAAATLAETVLRCTQATPASASTPVGVYRWAADTQPPTGVIGSHTMQQIVQVVGRDAADRG